MPDFQPNFVIIDPVTGQLSFSFPGSVTLPVANSAEGDNPSKIRWRRVSDGMFLAEQYAYDDDSAGSHGTSLNLRSFLQSETPASGDYSIARLSAQGRPESFPPVFQFANLDCIWIDDGAGGGLPYVQASTAESNLITEARKIIDSQAASDFVQYGARDGNVGIAMQVVAIPLVFPGAALSNTATIAHALGVVPNGVVMSPQNTAGNHVVCMNRVAFTNVNFTCFGATHDGVAIGPGTVNCHGIVWGFI